MDITNNENKKIGPINDKEYFTIKESKKVIRFYANVEFGMPSKNCANFGICRIHPVNHVNTPKKNCCKSKTFSAKISYYHSSKIEMSFEINKIGASCREKYFSSKYFRVEEEYNVTLQVNQDENKIDVEIKEGNYLIIRTKKEYRVIFS